MNADRAIELRYALVAVIATAASMGIDIELLCQEGRLSWRRMTSRSPMGDTCMALCPCSKSANNW